MELNEYACRVLDSFDLLKKLLSDRAECGKDEIIVYDEPLRLVIRRDRIEFYVGEEYHGMVGKDHISVSEELWKRPECGYRGWPC